MHTQETPFAYQPSLGVNLLSVRAGIPLATATEEASCVVEAATETVRHVACLIPGKDGAHLLWSAVYSLRTAHGLLEAVQAALEDTDEPEPVAELSYYIAPSDHAASGPFTWFVTNTAARQVVQHGTQASWIEADRAAVAAIKRLEQAGVEGVIGRHALAESERRAETPDYLRRTCP
jgi:hypothetical protein